MTTASDAVDFAKKIRNGLAQIGLRYVTKEGIEQKVKTPMVAIGDRYVAVGVNVGKLPQGIKVHNLVEENTVKHLGPICGRPVEAVLVDLEDWVRTKQERDKGRNVQVRQGLTYLIDLAPEAASKPKRYWVPTQLNYTDHYRTEFSNSPLDVPLGVNASGESPHYKAHVWEPLPKLQHVMVGGMTGGGKSNFIKCALAALLPHNSPETLRTVFIDGKDALGPWRNVPHLFTPYAKGLDAATYAIHVAKEELDRRNDQSLALGGDLDIEHYNVKAKLAGLEPWPYLWVIIDEAGDLATEAGDKSPFYADMRSLLLKGRSFGIFVWVTAQNPTVKVLEKAITGQMQSYFAFKVMDYTTAFILKCSHTQSGDKEISAEKITMPGRYLTNYRGWPLLQMQSYFMPKDKKLLNKMIQLAESWPAPGTVYTPQPGDALTDDDVTMCLTAIDNFGGQLDDGRWYYPIPVNATAKALPPSGKPGHLSQPRVRDRLSEFEQAGLIEYLDGDPARGRVMTEKLLHELEGALQSRGTSRQIPRFSPV